MGLMEKQLKVTGVLMDCDEQTCTLQVTTEDGSMVTWKSVGREKAAVMLMQLYQNGITAQYEEEPVKSDTFKLDNLKAELAAAQANMERKQKLHADETAPDMARHMADIEALNLEVYIEDLTQEIEELESNE